MNKKRLKFLALLFSMIFTLTACTNEAGEKENESGSSSLQGDTSEKYEKEIEDNNSSSPESQALEVVTLSRPHYNGINADMQNKIKEAMLEIYPDYELNLTTFQDLESYSSNIQISLMSGKPYDLMYAEKYLKVNKFIDNEYFKDIYELIENDKSIDIDDYNVDVLKAFESNGKLYRMPMNFVYEYFIGINANVSQESIDKFNKFDSISVNSMLDIYKQSKDDSNLSLIINATNHLNLIEPSLATYINFENKSCDFDNDRFKDFLTDIKNFMFSNGYQAYYDSVIGRGFYSRENDLADSTKSMFNLRFFYNLGQSLVEYADPYFEHFIPLTNENNELIISSDTVYCIGNTANAEMAWDFLKFYIDIYNEDISLYENMFAVIPIKKEFFDYKATILMSTAVAESTGIPVEIGDFMMGGNSTGYGGDLLYDTDMAVSRGIEKLKKYNEFPMINVQRIDTDDSLYRKTINDFMKGLITVDQAAQQIQNAMSLYLSE